MCRRASTPPRLAADSFVGAELGRSVSASGLGVLGVASLVVDAPPGKARRAGTDGAVGRCGVAVALPQWTVTVCAPTTRTHVLSGTMRAARRRASSLTNVPFDEASVTFSPSGQ